MACHIGHERESQKGRQSYKETKCEIENNQQRVFANGPDRERERESEIEKRRKRE